MAEELLVRHCSPVLAGMKTGNMFTCRFSDSLEMKNCIQHWNRMLRKKGLYIVPLRFRKNRALVYVYRPSRLSMDLQDRGVCQLLHKMGYMAETPEDCIVELKKRLEENDEFPHEIGVFLGYPLEDVQGFIENKASGCKYAGLWKVYGDADAAQKLFRKYKKCTNVYCTQFEKGKSIEQLTVAI